MSFSVLSLRPVVFKHVSKNTYLICPIFKHTYILTRAYILVIRTVAKISIHCDF